LKITRDAISTPLIPEEWYIKKIQTIAEWYIKKIQTIAILMQNCFPCSKYSLFGSQVPEGMHPPPVILFLQLKIGEVKCKGANIKHVLSSDNFPVMVTPRQ